MTYRFREDASNAADKGALFSRWTRRLPEFFRARVLRSSPLLAQARTLARNVYSKQVKPTCTDPHCSCTTIVYRRIP